MKICNTHKSWYTSTADENENRVYRANRYDMIHIDVFYKTGFEYRRMLCVGTSSALERNETRLVSLETHLVSFETSLARNETRLSRRW